MKHPTIRLSLLALAASLTTPVLAQSVNDFTLEPVPTPTATAQPQGPADTRNGVQIGPRTVNTPTPSPTPTQAPATTPTPEPSATPAQAPSAAVPPRSGPLPTVTPRPTATVTAQPEAAPAPPSGVGEEAEPMPTAAAPAGSASAATDFPSAQPGSLQPEEELPWLPIGGAAALLALLGAGLFIWRRRRDAFVPEIERPQVAAPVSEPPKSLADALSVGIEHEKLIRSAAFATLKYRMMLVNRTDQPLTDVSVALDLVSAHAASPMEEQVATLATALEKRHDLARIAPRQSITLEGQVQLPLAQAHVIRQGRTPLLVPLLRVRIDGPQGDALLKTFVVGQGVPGGGRVQPFRLDEGPRSYAPIAQRELA